MKRKLIILLEDAPFTEADKPTVEDIVGRVNELVQEGYTSGYEPRWWIEAYEDLEPEPAVLKATAAQSILPNSAPHILQPIQAKAGILQVAWIDQIGEHGAFYTETATGVTHVLATHHNGHSCFALTKHIAAGESKKAQEQFEFIIRCGGMGVAHDFIHSIIEDNASP